MHPEDRYIQSNLMGEVKMTGDIYFACEQGFITSLELQELSLSSNYTGLLLELFNDWYMNRACPEQQMLVDLNGFFALNDQFDDLTTILSLSIENEMFPSTEEDAALPEIRTEPIDNVNFTENPVSLEVMELQDFIYDKPVKMWFSEDLSENFPIRSIDDLENNTNLVYILNYCGRQDWKKLVNNLFFRLKNNDYGGIDVKTALDWFNHFLEVKKKERLDFAKKLNDSAAWTDEPNYIAPKKSSFVAEKLKIKKDKEESYAKKAIKRGLKSLTELLPTEDVNLFTSKDGFVVEGEKFNYRFRKGHTSIISHTLNPVGIHIPYDLIIMSKDNIELCNTCIYFDETPVIDQVIAAVLHLQMGNEDEILNTGNFYNKRRAFYTNETMKTYFSNEMHTGFYDEEVSNSESNVPEYIQDKIKTSVFNAIPTFLGLDLPEFIHSEFQDINFDYYIDKYLRTGELDSALNHPLQLNALENQCAI